MTNSQQILNRLTAASPIIEARVDELIRSVTQEELDEAITMNYLVSEALILLLDVLKDEGIKFHVDISELLTDGYNLDKVVTIYDQFSASTIRKLIESYPGLSQAIMSSTDGVDDEEYINFLLDTVAQFDEVYIPVYVYLHDKVISTSTYASRIRRIVEDIEFKRLNYQRNFEADPEFLEKLLEEQKWFFRSFIKLNADGITDVLMKDIQAAKKQFRAEFAASQNVSMLSRFGELARDHRELALSIISRIRSASQFYINSSTENSVSVVEGVSMILAQLSDQRLFGIEPKFEPIADQFTNINVERILMALTSPPEE